MVVYKVEFDLNLMLILFCAGYDYHETECHECGGEGLCVVGAMLIDRFFVLLELMKSHYDQRNVFLDGRVA